MFELITIGVARNPEWVRPPDVVTIMKLGDRVTQTDISKI